MKLDHTDGRTPVLCPECHGSGRTRQRIMPSDSHPGEMITLPCVCPVCGGRGDISLVAYRNLKRAERKHARRDTWI